MVAFKYRMPTGIAGDITRMQNTKVEPQMLTANGQTGAPTAYGVPVVIDATTGKVRTLNASDTNVYGFLVREYPTTGNGTDGLGTSTPPVGSVPCSVMVSGYMTVQLGGAASAVRGQPVWSRVATFSTGKTLGDIEAAADSANTIQIGGHQTYFMGPADANGLVEIAFNV